jgi:SAM-dependent methyltransferase
VEYLSVDIDYRKAMRKEDITDLSFNDESFDLIICIHVLEHILDDNRAMREIYRVLKRDGCALLDVPIDRSNPRTYEDYSITKPEARAQAFWQWDHVRLYGLDYKEKLGLVGFHVKEDFYIKSLGEANMARYGMESGPSYLCFKAPEFVY